MPFLLAANIDGSGLAGLYAARASRPLPGRALRRAQGKGWDGEDLTRMDGTWGRILRIWRIRDGLGLRVLPRLWTPRSPSPPPASPRSRSAPRSRRPP